jgi:hypothetical protein
VPLALLVQVAGSRWKAGDGFAGGKELAALDEQLIPLTRHEIRRVLTGLSRQLAAPAAQLRWSRWRRRHQATARNCHYRRRAQTPA